MLSLAIRNLARERVRLAISAGGIAFAVLLIVLVRGLLVAYETRVDDYFGRFDADLWVVQAGSADFFHSFSLLPSGLAAEVEKIEGVSAAAPYVARQLTATVKDKETVTYLVGVDARSPNSLVGALAERGGDVSSDSVILDRVFAERNGLEVGGSLTVEGRTLTVAGITTGGDLVMFQYAFVAAPTFRDLTGQADADNAIIVTLDEDADAAAVAGEIIGLNEGVRVRTAAEFVEVTQAPITDGFAPVIRVLVVLAFIVGVAVVGLTIYSAVVEKQREFGVIKAIGGSEADLAKVVLIQALISSLLGYVIGVALAYGAAWAATQWVPQFITTLRFSDIALVALATGGMAGIAALAPLIRLARVDPAEAFRA